MNVKMRCERKVCYGASPVHTNYFFDTSAVPRKIMQWPSGRGVGRLRELGACKVCYAFSAPCIANIFLLLLHSCIVDLSKWWTCYRKK